MIFPRGTQKVVGGLLESKNDRVVLAIKKAEEVIAPQDARSYREKLICMIELNLQNRKENDRESLNRRYGLQVDHSTFWKEKRAFCKAVCEELDLF